MRIQNVLYCKSRNWKTFSEYLLIRKKGVTFKSVSEKLTSGSTESYITFIRNVSVSAVKYAICFTSY